MSEPSQTQALLLDPWEVPSARALAAAHGVEVQEFPTAESSRSRP
ncbi:hypothetical protein [Nocardia arthritidis]|nr:hypothetical protein [Nocardia arthritidis]